jgi:hypothetical protein
VTLAQKERSPRLRRRGLFSASNAGASTGLTAQLTAETVEDAELRGTHGTGTEADLPIHLRGGTAVDHALPARRQKCSHAIGLPAVFFSGRSDREIGRRCQVAVPFVAFMRRSTWVRTDRALYDV